MLELFALRGEAACLDVERRMRLAGWLVVAGILVAGPLDGQAPTEPASPQACMAIGADAERLACYDLAFGRAADGAETPTQRLARDFYAATPATRPVAVDSLLDSRWELFPDSKLGTFGMRAYQPVYILPWVASRDVNQSPNSPAPGHGVTDEGLEKEEVKFQVSFKTKAWQGVFGRYGDLWLGYTQTSHWQLYNSERSRPFRETNYEPEALLVFGTNYRILGWQGRLVGVGLNHQSNGRDGARSRSWNRVTASVAFERPGWTLTLRPWWRFPESDAADDNPDIEDYAGRADLLLVRHVRSHEFAVLLRHSLRDGEKSRGALQLDWAFPLRGNLRAHVQVFHGFGSSLIDYNFRSTQLGLGLSLIEWY